MKKRSEDYNVGWIEGYYTGQDSAYRWFRDHPNKDKGLNKMLQEFRKYAKINSCDDEVEDNEN